MKVTELYKEIAERLDWTVSDVKRVFETYADIVLEEIQKGNEVPLPKLGKFTKSIRPPRTARNPKTGEKVQVPEKEILKFRVKNKGDLKKLLND